MNYGREYATGMALLWSALMLFYFTAFMVPGAHPGSTLDNLGEMSLITAIIIAAVKVQHYTRAGMLEKEECFT